MIYRSNLTCPDLTPYFKHARSAPEPGSFGHDVLHDWADSDYPLRGDPPGFLTHDEAAILWNCAKQFSGMCWWLDIGAATGWTTAHVAGSAPSVCVASVDPAFKCSAVLQRFEDNTLQWSAQRQAVALSSTAFFYQPSMIRFDGVMIDGGHDWHQPLLDTQHAVEVLRPSGVIILHDFIGGPVQEAVNWLIDKGFKARIYFTPFMLAVCWRGDFEPPNHVSDPNLPDLKARCPGFDFSRCS
jgi:precorrin-6B methylase 2